ncbi:MAG: ribonuclease P protein component [Brevinematia bacterium]
MKKGSFSLTNISLRKKSDLDKVYREGKRLYFKYYSVYYIPAEDKRVAFSIPAGFGTAVYRNRRKRILREYFRKNIEFLPSIRCVFNLIKKPESEEIEKKEIEKIIECLKSQKF